MSTIVTCTAVLCRHLADGVCSLRQILLGNAEFQYEKFCRINGSQLAYGDEQFCRSFAPARSPDASPSSAMTASSATAVPPPTMPRAVSAMTATEVADAPSPMPTMTMTATDAHANAGT